MNVVVVESPAKAKTINKYLGSDYKVVASYGHVRDLPAKDGSVLPDSDFALPWGADGNSEKHLKRFFEPGPAAAARFLRLAPTREARRFPGTVSKVSNSAAG